MGADTLLEILKQSLLSGAIVMTPILLTGIIVGITVGALQAATQVHEPTLTFVPKVLIVGLVGSLVLPWGFDRMVMVVQFVLSEVGKVPL